MAGIKIDPEMLDIYLESLNKLMAGSETDGGNARLEVSGAGKTEDGLVRYNEEVNKLDDYTSFLLWGTDFDDKNNI